MKEKFIFFLVITVILGLSPINAFASNSIKIEKSVCPYQEFSEVTSLVEGDTLIIEDTSNPLFWEFENYDELL